MAHPDDYQDEMERLSSQNAEEVLSGHRSGSGAARVAGAAADGLRQALLVPPAPEVAERHLAAMRAAAGSQAGVRRGITQRRNGKRFASLAMAAALVLGAGIAGALTLPEQASDVAEQRIEELQPPVGSGNGGQEEQVADDASEHGKAVSAAAHDKTTKGCEHGRAVSGVASSKAADNRQNEGDHPGPCGPNENNNGNRGPSNTGNRGEGNNGNHGANSRGNHGEGNNGNKGAEKELNPKSSSGAKVSNAGGNGRNELPHGVETAPGQALDETSETGNVPDALPSGS